MSRMPVKGSAERSLRKAKMWQSSRLANTACLRQSQIVDLLQGMKKRVGMAVMPAQRTGDGRAITARLATAPANGCLTFSSLQAALPILDSEILRCVRAAL